MNLTNLLAIGGGALGLANSDGYAASISSGAAIVSGIAGAYGNSDLAKIAGVTSLGSGAYAAFGGGDTLFGSRRDVGDALDTEATSASEAAYRETGPSGTGQSFSDAGYAAKTGTSYGSKLLATVDTPTAAAPPPSLMQSATNGLSSVNSFLRDNRDLVKVGGTALDNMFGAGRKQMSLMEERFRRQQEQIDRQNANANNVTALQLGVTVR